MKTQFQVSRPLSGFVCALLLSAAGSTGYGADPYGVSPPSGKKWTMTFDDEFTQDTSIDTNKWDGGAGGKLKEGREPWVRWRHVIQGPQEKLEKYMPDSPAFSLPTRG